MLTFIHIDKYMYIYTYICINIYIYMYEDIYVVPLNCGEINLHIHAYKFIVLKLSKNEDGKFCFFLSK
jgi:hypothetical protein